MIEMATTLAPSDTMQAFIGAVKSRMEEQGVSGAELSRRLGVAHPTISAILNGRGGSCSFATADRIAEALGTTTLDLLNSKH